MLIKWYLKQVVTGIALPSGSNKLYSGSTDKTVRVWDCQSGQVLLILFPFIFFKNIKHENWNRKILSSLLEVPLLYKNSLGKTNNVTSSALLLSLLCELITFLLNSNAIFLLHQILIAYTNPRIRRILSPFSLLRS